MKAVVTYSSIADRAAAVAACKATLNGLSTLTPVSAAAWGRGLGLARSSPPAVLSDVDVDVDVDTGNSATSSNGDRE